MVKSQTLQKFEKQTPQCLECKRGNLLLLIRCFQNFIALSRHHRKLPAKSYDSNLHVGAVLFYQSAPSFLRLFYPPTPLFSFFHFFCFILLRIRLFCDEKQIHGK